MNKETENAVSLVERVAEVHTKNTIILDDGSNEVTIPGFPYRFVAKEDKILVSVDIFKSGYECKTCKGLGKLNFHCACEDSDRPGCRYSKTQIEEFYNTLGETQALARMDMNCPSCQGKFEEFRRTETCTECKGKGALIVMPDESKSLPTTGVIVSIGAGVNESKGYKRGQRVLFGAYVGVMVPTKAPGVVFKVLRDIEILCEIKGGEDLATFDFVIQDKPL